MALPARDNRISRRSWLLASLAIPLFGARGDESLGVTFDGDNLHVAIPSLHFISGKPLERLTSGDTVSFLSQLTLYSDNHGTLFRPPTRERLVVSYDLWGEKFKVSIPERSTPPQYNLTAAQAEAWCVENLAISALGLAPDRPFWLRFELGVAKQNGLTSVLGDSGLNLTPFIDLISRRAGSKDPYWKWDVGPLRLTDLPRTSGRGTRNG